MNNHISIRFNTVEELDKEIEKVYKEYGLNEAKKLGFFINWTKNQIIYKDGDPLKISLRHTSEYDY